MKAILYCNGYQYNFELKKNEKKVFSSHGHAAIPLPQLSEEDSFVIEYLKNQEKWVVHSKETDTLFIEIKEGWNQWETESGLFVDFYVSQIVSKFIIDVSGRSSFLVSFQKESDIQIPVEAIIVFKKQGDLWWAHILEGEAHHNNIRLNNKEQLLEQGDKLSFGQVVMTPFKDEFHIEGGVENISLPSLPYSRYQMPREYPEFHRSPRLIYREPEEKITIKAPPQEPQRSADQLLRTVVPPAIMLVVSIAMAFIRPNAWFVLATAAMTTSTIIFSVIRYIKDRKKHNEDLNSRIKNYEAYLLEKSKELHQLREKQKQGQWYHYPDVYQLDRMVKRYDARIYEKMPTHFDFLHYRLGLGMVPLSAQLEYSKAEREDSGDELEEKGYYLYQKSLFLEDMPIVSDLTHGPVGYIGPRTLVIEQLQIVLNQLALFHSYHDVQFIAIFPEEEKPKWEKVRWLPHVNLKELNVRGFVYNQRSRDQVLNSLNTILKVRKNRIDEEKNKQESTRFSPHYVVLITDEKLILDHVIMDFFTEDPSKLGCSIIFVQDVLSSLSENVQTVIDIRDRRSGRLILKEGVLENLNFKLDHFPKAFDKELLPRTLAGLKHIQNLKSSIPESVTFLELYNAENVDELNVLSRWHSHAPYKSLEVPLGLRGKEDVVQLNLHEKAHGPHGLIAGTTGSGKSEILQSYILSLAVNFHPHDIGFLLIDYKGGGMANLFKDLPHLLGTITNLDKAQSLRALVSINAELKRRQTLFSENNVNHINQYQKLYKKGDVSEPMPHLFLISDEFAELKDEQPEFMDELISTARIGRSLGIHLILATQKPSGVVNDQIWSNSRFKIALKVADRQDSLEIIKTPDAAELTQVGRAYLQVGNNEIYELFQSAWSGADYQPEKELQNVEDDTIYRINDLGQYEILTEDLSGLELSNEIKKIPTELEAIVQGINDIVEKEKIDSLPKPWLPPLDGTLYVTELHMVNVEEKWQEEKSVLEPTLGIVDIPSQQTQELLSINLSKEGHIAVFSSPGYGKSTFIQTVIMDLVRTHSPEHLHVYLLDFGTNGLLPLKKLPHIVDTMGIDDEEKIGKFIKRIREEINRRKKLLSEYAVANLTMYEKASKQQEPSIVLALDNFDGMKDAKFYENIESLLTLITREGAGVGIHLIASAARQNSMRMNLFSNIKRQIPLKLIDDSDAKTIVGRTQLVVDDIPGRGLIKLEEPELFQTALPAKGEDDLQIVEAIQQETEWMDQSWKGNRPQPIPMVPEKYTISDLSNYPGFHQKQEDKYYIGLNMSDASPDGMNKNTSVVYLADNPEKVSSMAHSFIHVRHKLSDVELTVFDSNMTFIKDREIINQYYYTYDEIEVQLQRLVEDLELQKEIDKKIKLGQISQSVEYEERVLLFVEPIDLYAGGNSTVCRLLDKLVDLESTQGTTIIYATRYSKLNADYSVFAKHIKTLQNAVLAMKFSDQTLYKLMNRISQEEPLQDSQVYLFNNGYYRNVKIPTIGGE